MDRRATFIGMGLNDYRFVDDSIAWSENLGLEIASYFFQKAGWTVDYFNTLMKGEDTEKVIK